MSQGWLIVERPENWEVDARHNFSFFGLKQRYNKIAGEIKKDDSIVCYVSRGVSAFSDIRLVQNSGLQQLKFQSYNRDFPFFFSTSPELILPREKWIPLKDVASSLDLTKGRIDYRPILQTSIRKLSPHDVAFLRARMKAAI